MSRGRQRKGTLIWRASGWRAKVWIEIDGELVRKTVDLGTKDKLVARRRMARLVETGSLEGEDPSAVAQQPMTVSEAVDEAHERWTADGLKSANQRLALIERYALEHLGEMAAEDVRGAHVTEVLRGAKASGLSRQTVVHLRAYLSRVFDELWKDEVVSDNPVKRARMPKFSERKRPRAVLTDEEFAALVACPDVHPEVKMLALVSRTVGGMRAGDLNAIEWSAFDRPAFRTCRVPRAKTQTPQRLAVPDPLRPYLAWWWASQGEPEAGPVFPVRRGPRAGASKRSGNMSYAKRLRRALKRALGASYFDPDAGQRGRWKDVPRADWPPRWVELFEDTDETRRVDFHSCRRAFVTALAREGVNVQTAQILSGHSDAKVHQRYVASLVTEVPAGAVPSFSPGPGLFDEESAPKSEEPPPASPGDDSSFRRAGYETRTRDPQLGKGATGGNPNDSGVSQRNGPGLNRQVSPGYEKPGLFAGLNERPDPVEEALAEGIRRASEAGEWATVRMLASELEARRNARAASNVVPIGKAKGRGGHGRNS